MPAPLAAFQFGRPFRDIWRQNDGIATSRLLICPYLNRERRNQDESEEEN
jgi:hypothetical protein